MSMDEPCVNMLSQDKFERTKFVDNIVYFLKIPPGSASQVIAINSPWGYGKTSVLNFIRQELSKESNQIIFDFNPWIVSNREEIIACFLSQFALCLKKNNTLIGKKLDPLVKYTMAIGPFAVACTSLCLEPGIVASSIKTASDVGNSLYLLFKHLLGKRVNPEMISGLKVDACKAIKDCGKSITVIIDDIDRLPPEEVRIIMQLIKSVADFDGVTYLLAYEEQPVVQALSFDGVYDGRKYLEKIIQREFQLPRLNWHNKRSMLKELLDNVIQKNDLGLSEVENSLLDFVLSETSLIRVIDTPRDIRRLASRVLTRSRLMKNEVCFADIVVWETLEMKFPDIAATLRQRPDVVLGEFVFDENTLMLDHMDYYVKKIDEGKKGFKDILIAKLPERRAEEARNLLDFLFIHESKEHRPREYDLTSRVSYKNTLRKLLYGGVTSAAFSEMELNEFLIKPEIREQILLDRKDHSDLNAWIGFAKESIMHKSYNITDEKDLADCLIKFCLKHKDWDYVRSATGLMAVIYEGNRDSIARKNIGDFIVKNEISLSFSSSFMTEVLSKNNMYISGKYDMPKNPNALVLELDFLRQEWVSHISSITQNRDIFIEDICPIDILFRWGQLHGNFDPVQKYISSLISSGKMNYIQCIDSFSGHMPNGIEIFFKDIDEVIDELGKIPVKTQHQESAINYFKGKTAPIKILS